MFEVFAFAYRVREKDDPVVANELVEFDGTGGGLSIKVRGNRAQTEAVMCLVENIAMSTEYLGTYGARSVAIVTA